LRGAGCWGEVASRSGVGSPTSSTRLPAGRCNRRRPALRLRAWPWLDGSRLPADGARIATPAACHCCRRSPPAIVVDAHAPVRLVGCHSLVGRRPRGGHGHSAAHGARQERCGAAVWRVACGAARRGHCLCGLHRPPGGWLAECEHNLRLWGLDYCAGCQGPGQGRLPFAAASPRRWLPRVAASEGPAGRYGCFSRPAGCCTPARACRRDAAEGPRGPSSQRPAK